MLTQAARAGQLGIRGDSAKYAGVFRDLIEGLNQTLEAAPAPVRAATLTLEQLAARELTARVVGQFTGDHARIQVACNSAADALQSALTEVREASVQVAAAASQISDGSQDLAEHAS